MNKIQHKKLRFSDVVYAAGTTPKTVRNWLQRKQIRLTTFETDGWREFNLRDVLLLALIRRMVDHGVSVEEASDIANVVVVGYGIAFNDQATGYRNLVRFSGQNLILWRTVADWKFEVLDLAKTGANDLPPCFVSLSLEEISASAIERAVIGSDGERLDDERQIAAALEKLIITIKDATPEKNDS
ncbi:MerR family transcriptional regulator [Roseibium sp.]|uniref:MerR family transcriptional regulator n=1 Tax=Roseibium sp. TaxID=1936156 RepID=UPI001B0CC05B|nr:MerR family transcriptional regulator [Roseibium sp.]